MAPKSKLSYLRISPRKVRLIANIIKKKKVEEAQAILSFTVKKGAGPLLKLLNSAIASAKSDFQMDPSNLYISKIMVDEGPKYKRWRARSRGMASPIQKKTSHVTIILDEIVEGKRLKKEKSAAVQSEQKESPLRQDSSETRVEKKKEQPKPSYKLPKYEPKPKEVRGIRRFFRRKSV